MVLTINYHEFCPYYEAKCDQLTCPCPKWLAYEEAYKPGKREEILQELGIKADNQLQLMLDLQAHFATLFHPITDLTKIEVDHWVNSYLVCIEDELREVREHLSWKPWSAKTDSNVKELQKELIDIWHFLLDIMLVSGMTDGHELFNNYRHRYVEHYQVVQPTDYLTLILTNEQTWMIQYHQLTDISQADRDWLILFYQNCVQDAVGAVRQQISWKHWKKPSPHINTTLLHAAIIELFKYLVDLFVLVGFDADTWTEVYVMKNVENVLRQKHGY